MCTEVSRLKNSGSTLNPVGSCVICDKLTDGCQFRTHLRTDSPYHPIHMALYVLKM